jgi:hypothetical protein
MIRRHVWIAVLPVVILGIVAGGCANRLEHRYLQDATLRAAVDLSALNRLRKGDTNGAIEKLETDLNGARIEMEMFIADEPHPDTNYLRVLEGARAYQTNHPFLPKNNERH